VDDRSEKVQKKIRDTELKKVPYMLIVGEKEEADGTVSVRKQGDAEHGDKGAMPTSAFADLINMEVKEKLESF
jgi:threonyl-tRNA synthetase